MGTTLLGERDALFPHLSGIKSPTRLQLAKLPVVAVTNFQNREREWGTPTSTSAWSEGESRKGQCQVGLLGLRDQERAKGLEYPISQPRLHDVRVTGIDPRRSGDVMLDAPHTQYGQQSLHGRSMAHRDLDVQDMSWGRQRGTLGRVEPDDGDAPLTIQNPCCPCQFQDCSHHPTCLTPE